MKFEVGDTVRCITNCVGIKAGQICTIACTDYCDTKYDIKVLDANGFEWWVNSVCFEWEGVFKSGDIVTARETFVQDSRCIEADEKYKVVRVCNNHGLIIYLKSIENTWWVPACKMKLVNEDKAKERKVKGDTSMSTLKIKNVIFNDPATIVFWEDGVKTVVKCQKGDKFDPEKGLALAISKRVLGNNYIWHGRFMKWLPKPNKGEKK